jgi:hypothetical protein
MLDGDPGLGKSVVTLDLAARVSTGRLMPDGTPGRDGGVVLVSGEDGLADTVRPRLDAAGADVTRIVDLTFVTSDRSTLLRITNDLPKIEQAIKRVGAVLVVIDPASAFLGDKVNTDKDSQVRLALTPLAKMADRLDVPIILVRHLNKSEQEKAIYRGGGSIAFIGLARSGLLVGKAPNGDGMILASTKSNLAAQPRSLRYRLCTSATDVPIVEWLGETSETADQLIAVVEERNARPKTEAAAALLRRWLSSGPVPSKTLELLATQAGIAEKTYQRARELIGVQSDQIRGAWLSMLPTQMVRQSDSQEVGEFVGGGLA